LREFILLAPTSALSASSAGTLTRFLVGALLLSHGARRDVKASLLLGDVLISFEGGCMRNVRPDEQSLSGVLRAGLRRAGIRPARIMSGISARHAGLEELIEGRGGRGKLYYKGGGGRAVSPGTDFVAVFEYPVLGAGTEAALSKRGFSPVRLCGKELLPDQAAVMLNNIADRGG